MFCCKHVTRFYDWKLKFALKMEFLGCKDKTFEQGRERLKVLCLKTLEQTLSMRCFVVVLDLRGAQNHGCSQ